MRSKRLTVNLVLSGGGIKGIAYAGVFEAGEKRGFQWGNIAGVSAGALAGAYAAAGYGSQELLKVLTEFDFSTLNINDIPKKVPVVTRFMEFQNNSNLRIDKSVEGFLFKGRDISQSDSYNSDAAHRNLIKDIATYSKEGCLFDGDYLEEWVYETLQAKGVRTFADLRGGISDKVNPRGYRMRMTAVDATRKKIVVLPDDMVFYGVNPDQMEVARAVRMSTSVPLAFKPVEYKTVEDGKTKTYQFMDGGVLDNFPFWLISKSRRVPSVGFKLSGKEKKKLMSLDTPLSVIKALIFAAYDTGVPEPQDNLDFVGEIDTTKVKFLDFNLTKSDKEYLYDAGKTCGAFVFEALRRKYGPVRRMSLLQMLYRWFAR